MSEDAKEVEMTAESEAEPNDAVREGEAPSEPPGEPSMQDMAAGLPPVDVYSLLRTFIGMLGAQSWQWMGLVKDPSTDKIEKDLEQAKIAIDAIAALAAQLEGKVSESESAELKAMLSDLRINFVRQS